MTVIERLISSTLKRASDAASAVQRQAPAARMIGEFAVKQITKEVEKVTRRFHPAPTTTSSTPSPSSDTAVDDSSVKE